MHALRVAVVAFVACTVSALRLEGTGFHRVAWVAVPEAVTGSPEWALNVSFAKGFFVDAFEVGAAIEAHNGIPTSLQTWPARVDLEAPEFSPLATPGTVSMRFKGGRRVAEVPVPIHARYPVPLDVNGKVPTTVETTPEHLCLQVAATLADGRVLVAKEAQCADTPWITPRGDARVLVATFWANGAAMALGCLAILVALR